MRRKFFFGKRKVNIFQLKVIRALFVTVLACTTFSALSQTITIKENNAPLKKIFSEIKKQTGYTFFNNSDLIDKAKNVTIDIKNMPLKHALDLLCNNQPFTYAIVGKVITISPLSEKKTAEAISTPSFQIVPPEDSLIRGRIISATGFTLASVSVTNITQKDRQRKMTISNPDGSFEITGKKGDKLLFTSISYEKREIKYSGEILLNVTLKEQTLELNDVAVNNFDFTRKKIPWTDTIDMTHRNHLNLGQLLQGTIPGLTLQNSSQSQTSVASVDLQGMYMGGKPIATVDDIRQYYESNRNYWPQYKTFDEFFQGFVFGPSSIFKVNYSTSVNSNGLVPQLRGVSGFNGNTSGMLIVIDGFPQDGFPADYPMTNVESVRVIKDPEELTKWGPKAAGGVILITSKRGTAGKLQISYNSNFYYSPVPRFKRNKQRLASSADVLDYLRSAYDSGFITLGNGDPAAFLFSHSPADILLDKLKTGAISGEAFNVSWDSLGSIDNERQLGLLQQSILSQNQILTLTGGSKEWRFRFSGTYNTSRTTALDNYDRTVGLEAFNEFNLLKNKLSATWQIKLNRGQARNGYQFDPTNASVQPYQLLLDSKGGYVYDYSRFNPDANDVIMNAGYENYGVNLLQDARVNRSITKSFEVQSLLNTDWNLLPGLKWANSLQYTFTGNGIEDLKGAESSAARQTVDDYGSPSFNIDDPYDLNRTVTGILFYVPKGSILQQYYSKNRSWNLRSALTYNKSIGKNEIELAVGGSGSASSFTIPSYSTIYGYDPKTGRGQPVALPMNPLDGITNFYTISGVYGPGLNLGNDPSTNRPFTLLAPSTGGNTTMRQLGWNGNFKYSFDDTYILKGSYNAALSPNYGYDPPYTKLANYYADATWKLLGHSSFLRLSTPAWISDINLSSGIAGNKIPDLPTQIAAARLLQPEWNNYGIWVSNYNLAQQTGQTTRHIYEKLEVGMADNHLVLGVTYNNLNIEGNTNTSQSALTKNYVGADARLRLRKSLLNLIAGYGRSPEGQAQFNVRAGYDIAKETYFHSSAISSLAADFTLQNISSYQGLELMMETNAPGSNGGFGMAINNSFGLLPPQIKNVEAHAAIGFLNDRYLLDVRYYHKTLSGLNNSIPLPTDPSTGLGAQLSYSEIVNRGIEVYLVIKPVQQKNFSYSIILNGAYNKNIAKQVPVVNFSETTSYLTAYRNDYSIENIWSYRWAGLDNSGNPQIYDSKGKKTATPDSSTLASALIYSGVTRAPYSASLIQEWNFKGFFARITLLLKMGHVMREYIPSPSGLLDNSILIQNRWRQPGDEWYTDVPAMVNAGSTRDFITQNATNSILPADNIRLQEIQVGWQTPPKLLENFFVKDLMLSFQIQNTAVWTRNKLHVDPETVSSAGQIGLPLAKQYSFSLNMRF